MAQTGTGEKVRTSLWYLIEETFGGEGYDPSIGEPFWGPELDSLEERLRKRLGLWELAPGGHTPRVLKAFIRRATKEQLVVVAEEVLGLARDAQIDSNRLSDLKERTELLQRDIESIADHETPPAEERRWYETAQICLNGHIVNRMVDSHPEANADHCKDCGARTIIKCTACNTPIRGYKHVPGVSHADDSSAPKFCHKCGRPYPWTSTSVEAAKVLADEIAELDENERLLLKSSIDDIVIESPRTQVGIIRFKKYAAKAGKEAVTGIRDVLVDIVSETVRKALWPGS